MSTMTATPNKTAAKFRDMADRMQKEIDAKRGDRRENTPKQMREAASARIEADHLERTQRALRVLADLHEHGPLPSLLEGYTQKTQVETAVRTRIGSHSYYNVHDTGEYHDQSDEAKVLRAFMENAKTDNDRELDEATARVNKVREIEAKVKFADIPGFFPTPPTIIERMLDEAGIRAGMDVLEPSAGKGDIVDAIKDRVPGSHVVAIEINYTLVEILNAKGHEFNRRDFLAYQGAEFDRIVMNPPFENGQDIRHIMHAYSLLKDGGRLVAIMSTGPFFRNDAKSAAFRGWIVEVGAEISDLPPDAFKSSFRPTGVQTRLVAIDK